MTSDESPLPVGILIAGSSRSGSTLMDLLLGSQPGIVSLGEVHHLVRRGWLRNDHCGCGEPFRSCPFWQKMIPATWGADEAEPRALLVRQEEAERLTQIALQQGGSLPGDVPVVADTVQYLRDLYRRVAGGSNAWCIVDSSKRAPFLALAAEALNRRVVVIHLVRDSRAVAYSWHKVFKREGRGWLYRNIVSAFTSGPGWRRPNRQAERLLAISRLGIRVRYEDFCARPQHVLDQIAQVLSDSGLLESHVELKVPRELVPGRHHTVSGNPMRHTSRAISIRCDEAWREELPLFKRILVTAMTRRDLQSYGYTP